MSIRSYEINLDSFSSLIPEPIIGRQGDKDGAVTLYITVTDRGSAVDLTGQTINLMATTANGTAVVADNAGVTITDASNGKFTYAIPNALWSEAGKIKNAYFSLTDDNGQSSTYDLIFVVKKAVDINNDQAKDYVAIIDGTLRDLRDKVNTIHDAYQQGAFYSRNEIDIFLANVNDAVDKAAPKDYLAIPRLMLFDIGEFPENLRTEIDNFAGSIDRTKFTMLWVSDSHYEDLADPNVIGAYPNGGRFALNHAAIVDFLSNYVDVVMVGGDNTNGIDNDLQHTISDQALYASRILESSSSSDKFMLIGNHDDGSPIAAQDISVKPSMVMTNNDFEKVFMTRELAFDENRNDGSVYFYKDYPDKRMRVIGLNSLDIPYTMADSDGTSKYTRWLDYGFNQEQFNWLVNDALKVPDGYSTIIATHVPLTHGYSPISKVTYYNYDLLENVLNAFASGSAYTASSADGTPAEMNVSVEADFTAQGKRSIAGFYGGHVHSESLTALTNFTQVIFLADVNVDANNIGTINELGMSVIEVDTTDKSIAIKGLGRATNRSYNYI